MKKTSILFVFAAFLIASMFTSCSFLQKGEFSQRKYYNFPRSGHTVEAQTASVEPKHNKQPVQAVVIQEEKQTAEPVLSASTQKEIIVSKTEKKESKVVKRNTISTSSDNDKTKETVISYKKSEIRKQARKESKRMPSSDAGMMLFLAVIAAIFFPPLGVYIKDHHTNKWFWITLLLCLLGGGLYLFYTGIFGLLYLVAIIIALMDVFDIL